MTGTPRDSALASLGESWSEKDAPRAAEFAAQLPAGPVRKNALGQAISKWIIAEPDKASTWVNRFEPHEDFDKAIASVATLPALIQDRTDVALQWASTIFNESVRTAAFGEIVSRWSIRDRAAALEFVQSSRDLSTETRATLARQLQASEQ